MNRERKRKLQNEQLDRELDVLLLAISGTLQRIAGNIQILCAKRQMKGANYDGNR